VQDKFSLKHILSHLSNLTGKEVKFAESIAAAMVEEMSIERLYKRVESKGAETVANLLLEML